MIIYRQGDVILKSVDSVSGEKQDNLVLATGEATGHAHRIIKGEAELYRNVAAGLLFLRVLSESAELFHEEHESIILPYGDWEIKQQREWNWFIEETRNVKD